MAVTGVQTANFEKIFDTAIPMYCPIEDAEGNLYVVSTNGEVYLVSEG